MTNNEAHPLKELDIKLTRQQLRLMLKTLSEERDVAIHCAKCSADKANELWWIINSIQDTLNADTDAAIDPIV